MMVDLKALKPAPIYWTPEGTLAFNETTIAVSHRPFMYFINDDSPFNLYTDASDHGIGGLQFSFMIVKGKAISVRFGNNRDKASANPLSDPLTKCTVKSTSCIAMNHRATIEVGFYLIKVKFI